MPEENVSINCTSGNANEICGPIEDLQEMPENPNSAQQSRLKLIRIKL